MAFPAAAGEAGLAGVGRASWRATPSDIAEAIADDATLRAVVAVIHADLVAEVPGLAAIDSGLVTLVQRAAGTEINLALLARGLAEIVRGAACESQLACFGWFAFAHSSPKPTQARQPARKA